jgi:1-deoxy-D-xylulose-5-phosphate synthase
MDVTRIQDPGMLKGMSVAELEALAADIRQFLIENVSKTGGHFSSNLGAVELTIALHKVFDSPADKLIFDVGHQGYTHKILTGRGGEFSTLRKHHGLSGYLKRSESEHDIFEAGHSSTSLAAMAGIEAAKSYQGNGHKVVAIIGDGALTGGMAFEALNYMGNFSDHQPVIILNDNEMSISENIGYLSRILNSIRAKSSYRKVKRKAARFMPKFLYRISSKVERGIKGFLTGHTMFDDLGFSYYGPINGHNMKELLRYLTIAKKLNKPCVIHVLTEKGKGYKQSELDQTGLWHGVSPFDIETGEMVATKETTSWSEIIGHYVTDFARRDPNLAIVVPAMIAGSGLIEFQKEFPDRIYDVGIAEQMAVTMSAGLAISGVQVFCPIYSTFLQRAYDQVNHDVARQRLNVVFGIDRAGLVGADGETHQGVFDIPLLRSIPHMTIVHPHTPEEAFELLNTAYGEREPGPFVVRYERGSLPFDKTAPIPSTKAALRWTRLRDGNGPIFIAFGSILSAVLAHETTAELDVQVINARVIKPLDTETIDALVASNRPILIYEESVLAGGFGSAVLEYLNTQGIDTSLVYRMGIGDVYVDHGSKAELLEELGLDADAVLAKLETLIP